MSWIDWCITLIPMAMVIGIAIHSRTYIKGVVDYLAAGRVAGNFIWSIPGAARTTIRHRAPLFIAEFDPDKPAVLSETEQIVVPEHGARLGNFTAASEDENHAFVSVAEWMQTVSPDTHDCRRCEKYGADNRIWYVKMNV